jgi:hypothetical protein
MHVDGLMTENDAFFTRIQGLLQCPTQPVQLRTTDSSIVWTVAKIFNAHVKKPLIATVGVVMILLTQQSFGILFVVSTGATDDAYFVAIKHDEAEPGKRGEVIVKFGGTAMGPLADRYQLL